ncbi:MAG: HipA domain-containing protein, partial [Noviherbaspirillum sp.]
MHQHSATILDILAAAPQPATELCRRLGISQPTLSRRLAELGDAVLRFGPQKAVRYARRRPIRHWDQFTLSRITREGQLQEWGRLYPVAPQGFILTYAQENRANERYEGLPWWMQDMRPQGFLGRSFVKAVAAQLALPDDLRMWSDDHVLLALAESGEDVVGNLLVGDNARRSWLGAPAAAPLPQDGLADRYRGLARRALAGEVAGSSAGGEQPKFTAWVETTDGPGSAPYHALVKFTAPEDNASTRRWRNLLACEHLALTTLYEAGLPASRSRLLDCEGQRFLEVRRFDREGELGRHGVV